MVSSIASQRKKQPADYCKKGGGGGGGDERDTRTAAGGKEGLKVETVELKVFTESEQQGPLSQRV